MVPKVIVVLLSSIICLNIPIIYLLLFTKSKRQRSNLFLGLYLALVFIAMLGNLVWYLIQGTARYAQYNSSLALALPPLLYLHVSSVLNKKWRFTRQSFLHFVPSLGCILLTLNKVDLLAQHRIALYISAFFYVLMILNKLKFAKSSVVSFNKANKEIIYKWGRHITLLFTLIFLLDSLHFLGFNWFGKYLIFIELVIISLALIFVIYVGYHIRKLKFRHYIFGLQNLRLPFDSKKENFSASSSTFYQGAFFRLQNYVEEHQPFLNPELTLGELSQQVNLTERELSTLLNTYIGTNFVSFINSYRINMAKDLLKTSKMTISEIMYEVGFNSRSTFNTLFKKETGKTPTEFKGITLV